jgi:hypothetical protein
MGFYSAGAIIAGWTQPDTLVVVTHGANILPLAGETPEEGGMVIVKPDPGSAAKLRTLGHISPLPQDHDRRAGNRNDVKRCGWYAATKSARAARSPMASGLLHER